MQTNTKSLVGNEGLKSESIMNVLSGRFRAISRDQVLDSNEKWSTEMYGTTGSDVSRQHAVHWFKYICIHSVQKRAIFY